VLSVGFLSGCNDQIDVSGETNKVTITEYSVTTEWYELGDGFKNRSGFFHDYHQYLEYYSQYEAVTYRIRGTLKNTCNEYVDMIIVTASFCDKNNNVLAKTTDTNYDLPADKTRYLLLTLHYRDTEYFDDIEKVRFEISAS